MQVKVRVYPLLLKQKVSPPHINKVLPILPGTVCEGSRGTSDTEL